VSEPTPPPGEDSEALADWWRRLVAFVLDLVVVGGAVTLAWVILGGDIPKAGTDDMDTARGLAVAQLGGGLLYFGLLNGGPRGQTLGKATLRIQVRDAVTGGPLGYPRGLARFAIVWVFLYLRVLAVIDGAWALFDPRRQTWHDKIVRSVVLDASTVAVAEGRVEDS
jgi:uncharacterized RDD family membrane protein YckC